MSVQTIDHIVLDDRGTAWIDESNVKVIEVVADHFAYGWSPGEIHFQHPHLSLSQIHAALSYYYDHQVQLDAEIARRQRGVESLVESRGSDSDEHEKKMSSPSEIKLPFFVYGTLKPGMPAHERLRDWISNVETGRFSGGELYVRDGLPLLKINNHGSVDGYLLHWKHGEEKNGYDAVCEFEPRQHYIWDVVELASGVKANVLTICFPEKGNPQPLPTTVWRLTDDPTFSAGIETVQEMLKEVDRASISDTDWQQYFRVQMAYLLLWSILERLSALCFGPDHEPTKRAKRLYELSGMPELVRANVRRPIEASAPLPEVSDSRNPKKTYKLDRSKSKKCFEYYYQVRCNLSHRGKGVKNEFETVRSSLRELLAITEQYLLSLKDQECRH